MKRLAFLANTVALAVVLQLVLSSMTTIGTVVVMGDPDAEGTANNADSNLEVERSGEQEEQQPPSASHSHQQQQATEDGGKDDADSAGRFAYPLSHEKFRGHFQRWRDKTKGGRRRGMRRQQRETSRKAADGKEQSSRSGGSDAPPPPLSPYERRRGQIRNRYDDGGLSNAEAREKFAKYRDSQGEHARRRKHRYHRSQRPHDEVQEEDHQQHQKEEEEHDDHPHLDRDKETTQLLKRNRDGSHPHRPHQRHRRRRPKAFDRDSLPEKHPLEQPEHVEWRRQRVPKHHRRRGRADSDSSTTPPSPSQINRKPDTGTGTGASTELHHRWDPQQQ